MKPQLVTHMDVPETPYRSLRHHCDTMLHRLPLTTQINAYVFLQGHSTSWEFAQLSSGIRSSL